MELPDAVRAHASRPRGRTPAYRRSTPCARSPLTFEPVRLDDFPGLRLGVEAGRAGGAAPAVFNAANEQAVAIFLEGRIGFTDIAAAIAGALDALRRDARRHPRRRCEAADAAARAIVRERFGC